MTETTEIIENEEPGAELELARPRLSACSAPTTRSLSSPAPPTSPTRSRA